ncbi:MAG: metalloregulator ArsR/SmtB family transcription factor [Flavobacteriales bacterium]|nr:metalloregulator ArsR/SmtB family transcription factor [Flavobacteriales bacterium]
MAKALSHPARISILSHIIRSKSCINSNLVKELGLAQATISQHLNELKKVELIQGSIEGKSMCYCINPEKWKTIKNLFKNWFDRFNCDDQNCC